MSEETMEFPDEEQRNAALLYDCAIRMLAVADVFSDRSIACAVAALKRTADLETDVSVRDALQDIAKHLQRIAAGRNPDDIYR